MGPSAAPLSIQSLPKTVNITNGTPSAKHLKSTEKVLSIGPTKASSSQDNQLNSRNSASEQRFTFPSQNPIESSAPTAGSSENIISEKHEISQKGQECPTQVIKDHDYLDKKPEVDKIKTESVKSSTNVLSQEIQSTKVQSVLGNIHRFLYFLRPPNSFISIPSYYFHKQQLLLRSISRS